jgi:hypothetical protein
MYRSPTYAGQKSKSVFVEMSERSAETARLLQQAREAQPAPPAKQTRSLAGRLVSQGVQLLEGLGKRVTQLQGETRG